jgi:hypothetical protein
VADFEIQLDNKVIAANNIPAGEQIVFKSNSKADYFCIWTGDNGSVYTGTTEVLTTSEKKTKYTFADGKKDTVIVTSINGPVNSGQVVDIKTGTFAYTYPDVAVGDTTYEVVWIAVNTDVKGNVKKDIKKLKVTVKK